MALIDVVKFNGLASRDWIVYKHYAEDLSTATQLIVAEGQVAAFVKGGQLCDLFGPGTYTLSTNNIPILSSLINIPFGGRTPFTAEIYYLNAASKLDINWGTSDPIQLVDPKYHIRLRIRAFGQAGLKICDYALFLKELIGTLSGSEIVSYDRVLEHFKGALVSKVKSHIAQIIIRNQISALEITPMLDDISSEMKSELGGDFAQFGISLVNFYVKSINFPDEDFDKINDILANKAEFDIMGDSRYATMRTFDVYEGAANNSNGAAGAFMAGGIGFGAGSAMASAASAQAGAMKPASGADTYCPKCHAANPTGAKFCNSCGAVLTAPTAQTRKCPSCGADVPTESRFCMSCGAAIAVERVCECGQKIPEGARFCNHCGRKVGD